MMVAVERYLARDHDADWREWERRVGVIRDALASLPGVRTERFVPAIANQVPHARIRWDRTVVKIEPAEVVRELRDGQPSIELVPIPYESDSLEVASWTLQPGEAETIARRIAEVLSRAA
jgi:L-seryl-tRNA(Ser) seleniumtransferase